MRITQNIKQTSVMKFTENTVEKGNKILSDGYRSYLPALKDFVHEHKVYKPDSGSLHWLHIMIILISDLIEYKNQVKSFNLWVFTRIFIDSF